MTKPLEPRTLKGIAQDQLLNGVAARVCERSPGLKRLANRYVINSAIDTMPPRPYRLSTMHEYTSWDSLTDRTYSVRELDAVPAERRTEPPGRRRGEPVPPRAVQRVREVHGAVRLRRAVVHGRLPAQPAVRRARQRAPSRPRDVTRNDSTHQVDLAQVYGLTAQATESLREGRRLAYQEIDGQQYPPALFADDGTASVRGHPDDR